MKECRLALIGLKCSSLPDGNCVILSNEGLGEGTVAKLESAAVGISERDLGMYMKEYSPGGKFRNICKVSSAIYDILVRETNRRGTGSSEGA